jgi:hypothetical protein
MTRALLAAVVLLLALLGWQWGRAEHAGRRADGAESSLAAEQQARRDEAKARETEFKRAHRLQEALDAEHLARLALEADLRNADAAAVGLRNRARELAAAARQAAPDSGPACSCEAAGASADLLAFMRERLDERAGELARYADQARLAGLTCERAYEALTVLDE